MLEKINSLKAEIEQLTAANAGEVEALRIKYLSKKGEISVLFNEFRNLPGDQKRVIGALLNQLKDFATNRINELRESMGNADNVDLDLDLSRTASPIKLGTRHPLSLVRNEIVS